MKEAREMTLNMLYDISFNAVPDSTPTPDMFSKLPEEIISMILTKLPAKDLVNLMRFSKLFKLIISQPYFLDLHLSTLLHQKRYFSVGVGELKQFNFFHHDDSDSLVSLSSLNQSPIVLSICDDYVYGLQIVGSTRGLVCLFNWQDYSRRSFSLTLWNPSIGKLKELPLLPDFLNNTREYNRYNIAMGFAFDHASVDYKVVLIFYKSQSPRKGAYPAAKVVVYAQKRNSWSNIRQLELPCYYISGRVCTDDTWFRFWISLSVGEFACWWGKKENEVNCIMTFNVVNDVFEVLELPQDICMWSHGVCLRLFSMVDDQSLALFVSTERSYYRRKWSVWVMNVAGCSNSSNPKSWEKRYNLELNVAVSPVGMVNGTQVLASTSYSYCGLIDLVEKNYKELEACSHSPLITSITDGYVPSLALLDI